MLADNLSNLEFESNTCSTQVICYSVYLSNVSIRFFWCGYPNYVIDESTEKFRLT